MKRYRIIKLLTFFAICCCTSCVQLKPYQQIYIKDPEMQLGLDATGDFQNYVYKIREGATPAGLSKSSGGCGCN